MTEKDLPTTIRDTVHDWIRDVVPLAGKLNLTPRHVDALVARLDRAVRDCEDKGYLGDTGWR